MNTGQEPAFPIPHPSAPEMGLSKREYYAAMAMQGIVGREEGPINEQAAALSVRYADALIAELGRGE